MIRLGEHGPDVSRLGLGCMGMSGMYGPAERDEAVISVKFGAQRGPDGAWLDSER